MTQVAIDFGPGDRIDHWWRDVHRVVVAAVDRIGLKEAAFRMDCQPSLLADQIAERNSKALRARQLLTLIDASAPAVQDELTAALVMPVGYEMPQRRKVLTADQELSMLRASFARLAPAVLAIADKEIGR